ncbi:phage holin [Sinanaerobacter sp. ZZT-01]|uniref:phage holin n=1 Tax=Sinanaerobacter sp. ZZT-01 TaxID=3111540 RepID=UPI002D7898C7|nr:phage holin [Sinanaerobacter sp. ZZT-01]WRR94311.1 phage holin [Sinanaerobacter sp. ZZT-01]
MKINWILRLKNKATLSALLACLASFVYQILGIFGITTSISQDEVMQIIGLLVNILVAIGIVVDPTTPGANDSDRVMEYKEKE